MNKLSIINPIELKETGINVDSQYRFEKEDLFNPKDITWVFYGNPYEHVIVDNSKIETKYGFEHSWGYIESIKNPNIKYDVLYGLLINRVDTDLDDDCLDSNSNSNQVSNQNIDLELEPNQNIDLKLEPKQNNLKRKANFLNYEIPVDVSQRMDFESGFDNTKIKYIFVGEPINKFHQSGFEYSNGILTCVNNHKKKFKLTNGIVSLISDK